MGKVKGIENSRMLINNCDVFFGDFGDPLVYAL